MPQTKAKGAEDKLDSNDWKRSLDISFQFPHPNHREEAHTLGSRIYDIQIYDKYLISCGSDSSIRIWNVETQRLLLPPLFGHEGSVLCSQLDINSDTLISGGTDTHVMLWQFSTGKLLNKIQHAHQETVLSIKFNDDWLVTASKDRSIKIWDRKSLSLGKTLEGHTAAVNSIKITNKQVISGSGDGRIKIWDLTTGQCLRTFTGHEKGVASLDLTADGTKIISGSSDKTIRVFDIDGAEASCLRGHSDLIRTVKYCAATNKLAKMPAEQCSTSAALVNYASHVCCIVSGSYDGSIVIWIQDSSGLWIVSEKINFRDTYQLISGRAGDESVEAKAAEKLKVFCVQADERRLFCSGEVETIFGWNFGLLEESNASGARSLQEKQGREDAPKAAELLLDATPEDDTNREGSQKLENDNQDPSFERYRG